MVNILNYVYLRQDEEITLRRIIARLEAVSAHNNGRQQWYDAQKRVVNLGVSLPKRTFDGLVMLCGWPALAVDALEERLNVSAAVTPGLKDGPFSQIWAESGLDDVYSPAHLEALIQGVAFLASLPQGMGEDVRVFPLDPVSTSGIFDPLSRQLTSAATVSRDEQGRVKSATLFTAEESLQVEATSGRWKIVDVVEHGLGRVPVRPMVNRPRLQRQWGRSELTAPLLAYTRAAIRTLIRSEISSEFFSAPQRWALGLSQDAFVGPDGSPLSALQTYLGHLLSIGDDETNPDYKRPEFGEFKAASPEPFIQMIRMYSMLVSGESAVPPQYLGFVTENPASADQIRAVEARLVLRAERRQRAFGAAWRAAILDAVEMSGVSLTDELRRSHILWGDAATPTRAATTDAVVKQIQVGALPATAPTTYRLLGHPEPVVRELVQAATADQFRALVTGMGATRPPLPVSA